MQGVPPWKILSTVLLTKEPKFASYLHCWLEFTVAESTYLSWKQSSKISICTFTNYLQGQNQLYLQNSISVGFFWFFGCFFFFFTETCFVNTLCLELNITFLWTIQLLQIVYMKTLASLVFSMKQTQLTKVFNHFFKTIMQFQWSAYFDIKFKDHLSAFVFKLC